MDVLSALNVIYNASDEELKEALASESIHDLIFETLGRVQSLVVTTSAYTIIPPSRTSSPPTPSSSTSSPPTPSPSTSSSPHPTPENSKAISLFKHVERSIPWLLDFTKHSPEAIIQKKGSRTWDPRLDDILRCRRKATRQEILFRGYAQRSLALQFIQEQELQGRPSRVEELCLAVLNLAIDTDQSRSILNQKSHSIACFVKDHICLESHHDEYGSALEGVYTGLRILVAERLLEKRLSQSLNTAGLAAVLAAVARFSFASFETIRDLISCIVANPEINPLRKKSSTTEERPRRILEILLELSPWSSDFQSCYTSLKTRRGAGSSSTELRECIQSSNGHCSDTSDAHRQWSDTSSVATDLAEDDDFAQPSPKRPCLDHSAARPYPSANFPYRQGTISENYSYKPHSVNTSQLDGMREETRAATLPNIGDQRHIFEQHDPQTSKLPLEQAYLLINRSTIPTSQVPLLNSAQFKPPEANLFPQTNIAAPFQTAVPSSSRDLLPRSGSQVNNPRSNMSVPTYSSPSSSSITNMTNQGSTNFSQSASKNHLASTTFQNVHASSSGPTFSGVVTESQATKQGHSGTIFNGGLTVEGASQPQQDAGFRNLFLTESADRDSPFSLPSFNAISAIPLPSGSCSPASHEPSGLPSNLLDIPSFSQITGIPSP